jgi:hypothetical protein
VVTYWGTPSGEPLPEPYLGNYLWTAQQLRSEDEAVFASWPKTLRLEIDGWGRCCFVMVHPEVKQKSLLA